VGKAYLRRPGKKKKKKKKRGEGSLYLRRARSVLSERDRRREKKKTNGEGKKNHVLENRTIKKVPGRSRCVTRRGAGERDPSQKIGKTAYNYDEGGILGSDHTNLQDRRGGPEKGKETTIMSVGHF